MNIQIHQIKYWVFALLSCLCPLLLPADDLTVDGKLTVTEDLKAGTDSLYNNFEFRNNGIVISKGSFTANDTLLSADQEGGVKMLWYPQKGAFRAGGADHSFYHDEWDDNRIGFFSVAFGAYNTASGAYSVASGYYCYAQGEGAFVHGYSCYANGNTSAALNTGFAAGDYSAALNGGYAAGDYSAALNDGYATGDYSAAFGQGTNADASHSFVVGRYNIGGCAQGGETTWNAADPLFEVGNGSPGSPATYSDAFVVYKNGNAEHQGTVKAAPGGDIPMYEGQ